METAPAHLDVGEIRGALLDLEGVRAIHDLHVWTIGSGEISLSAHVVIADEPEADKLLDRVRDLLRERFAMTHTTIQIEPASFVVTRTSGRPKRFGSG